MIDFLLYFPTLFAELLEDGFSFFVWQMLHIFIIIEVPFFLIITLGALRFYIRRKAEFKKEIHWYPKVSIVITCYGEGEAVNTTLNTLFHQEYPGILEVIPVVDGSVQNALTYATVLGAEPLYDLDPKRKLIIVKKKMRGGRVSTLNTGLNQATGEIVINLDGDTSVDNDMIMRMTRNFLDPNIMAVSGNIKVRNIKDSWITRVQSLEYLLGISMGRVGLGEFDVVNNISGAFGAFRTDFIKHLGGWDTGTAEDLSLTTRIKAVLHRYPGKRIAFEPDAVAHTDAPVTVKQLFDQRARWDGDLIYVYFRKYWRAITPRILGWKNFVHYVFMGIFLQILLPFILVGYQFYLLITKPLSIFFASFFFVYILYLMFQVGLFLLYILLVARDKKNDFKQILWLPLVPLYTLALRLLMPYFIFQEVFLNAHLDSSMAPWWVLKKGGF